MKVFTGAEELVAAAGEELGTSGWETIDQQRIDAFADATGDHQWIHTDPERAAAGPFGGTIAHGFLSLSLLPVFWHDVYEVEGAKMAINYGLNKLRFISPVSSGARVRATVTLTDVIRSGDSLQATVSTNVEIDGVEKPALVADSLVRYVF